MHEWMHLYEQGQIIVDTIKNATGCTEEEAWEQWADDNDSKAATPAETLAYSDGTDQDSDGTMDYDAVNGEHVFS
jgi:hypothetical protein